MTFLITICLVVAIGNLAVLVRFPDAWPCWVFVPIWLLLALVNALWDFS